MLEVIAVPDGYLHQLNRRKWLQLGLAATVASTTNPARADLNLLAASKIPGRLRTSDSHFKQLARDDYQKSFASYGGKLSAEPNWLFDMPFHGKPHQFDILIVGSGYGASVTAARLSAKMRPGTRIAVLERGREWVPGDLPDTMQGVTSQNRLDVFGIKKNRIANPTGLFNVLQAPEFTVLSSNALGGSSVINANVAYVPDREVFLQREWPTALRDIDFLSQYFEMGAMELGVRREPIDHTSKMRAQRLAAEKLRDLGFHFEAAQLTISRASLDPNLPVVNRHGVLQRNCLDCSDCLTGCNVGAKNTLATSYLAMARRNNTMLFTQTAVHRIEKCNGVWKVHFTHYTLDQDGKHTERSGVTTCRVLILGCGSVGSSELLLRSQAPDLALSNQLGRNWSGNGDALGFVRKTTEPAHSGGTSAYPTNDVRSGPTVQTNVSTPFRPNLHHRILIQEGVAARAYSNYYSLFARDLDLDHTQILLGMGHDGQQGTVKLDERGLATIHWPEILKSDYRTHIRQHFQKIAEGHGGQYRFVLAFGDRMITVHPLGGCRFSDDPRMGVTNHKGQVYDLAWGGDFDQQTQELRVHEGLYVCDSALLPTAIACNPFMTITAIAERNAQLIALEPKYSDLFNL